jgi:hypothetical protein
MQRGATLGQAGQPGGDGGELVGFRPVQAVGDRDRQPVGRHHHRVGHPWGALGEVANQPVEVAGFDTELRMAVLTLWRLATVEPLHAAGLRPRWSLGTYCRSHRDNMLGSLAWPADWTGPDHAQ